MLKNLPPFFPILCCGPYYRVSKNQRFSLDTAEGIKIPYKNIRTMSLKDRLRDPERPCLYGTCAVSTSPHFLAVAASCKLDFVFIDTEHIALDREKLAWMCSAYASMGVSPIVRVCEAYGPFVTGALDGGACGIVSTNIFP